MKLIGNLCTIAVESENDYVLALDKDHFIYRAHFPGKPVTPGACIIQLCKELMERRAGCRFVIARVTNAKFLAVIDPTEVPRVEVAFTKIIAGEDGVTIAAVARREAVTFARVGLHLKRVES
jgi:3-hydroxyacyl-[acyl-carrier-protein] dehydratase